RRHTRCLSDWSSDVCSSDLTSKKWVTGRADADFDVAPRRTCVISRAARARNRGLLVVGMNICFHGLEKGVQDSRHSSRRNQKLRSEERRVGKERKSRRSANN